MSFPVVLEAQQPGDTLEAASALYGTAFEAILADVGGVLLRGFAVPSIEHFRQFAASFGLPLMSYVFASTPRSALAAGVYTSTEYPAHQHIPLHSEQSYTREWPMKIWFHCVTPARAGGETPIADTRAIFKHIPDPVRKSFADGLLYVRNFGEFDVPWQKAFSSRSRHDVEAFCARAGIQCEWRPNGELRTRQLCQAIEVHPRTGQAVWFNQAHLFHISSLQPDVRGSLVDILGIENVPRNVYLADGRAISDSVMQEIRGVLDEAAVLFPWQAGDVLFLDNMLVAHGRSPYEGPRKVVVAMAEAYGNPGQ